jgi:kynureninase
LGLQPRRTAKLVDKYLQTWAMKGVNGHFQSVENSELKPWLDIDAAASKQMAHVLNALPSEIAIMGTLTANLHLLMASFYRPTEERYKILLEGKAFPSDHVSFALKIWRDLLLILA